MKTSIRIAAKRAILYSSIFWVMLPSAALETLHFIVTHYHLIDVKISPYFLIGFLLMQPILSVIIAGLRLWDKADARLLEKWEKEKNQKLVYYDTRKRELVQDFHDAYFQIISVEPVRGRHCMFKITFSNSVKDTGVSEAKPIIKLGKTVLPFEVVGEREVACLLDRCIKATTEEFVIECGESKFKVLNPYFMNLTTESVCWQNEGHMHEKRLFIDGNCFPFKTENTYYAFDLLIHGVNRGTFYGYYVAGKNEVIINISDVKKSECSGKKCVLRPTFDKGVQVKLPEPKIFAVNTPVNTLEVTTG